MSIDDVVGPLAVGAIILMLCLFCRDRLRLSFLEDDNREHQKRILKLETNVMFLEKWIKRVEAKQ